VILRAEMEEKEEDDQEDSVDDQDVHLHKVPVMKVNENIVSLVKIAAENMTVKMKGAPTVNGVVEADVEDAQDETTDHASPEMRKAAAPLKVVHPNITSKTPNKNHQLLKLENIHLKQQQ